MDKHVNAAHHPPSYPPISIVLELGGLKRIGVPELRILYALSGTAQLTHNGLHHLELAAGSVHIINPGDFFEIAGMDNFAAVIFSITMEPFYAQMPSLSGTSFSILAAGVDQNDYDELSQLLLRALKIFSDDSEESVILQSLNTHSIILLLLKKFQQHTHNSINVYKTNDSTIQKLMNYIDQHCTQKLSLPALAEMVYLNPQYLSRLFKRETGITLIRYINHIRILKSERDILHSGLCATDIAEKYGFANTKSFYKVFREVFGKTPGEHKADTQRESDNQQQFHLRCPSPMFFTQEMVRQFIQRQGDDGTLEISLPDPLDWSPISATEHRVQISVSGQEGHRYNTWSYSHCSDVPEPDGAPEPMAADRSHRVGKIGSHLLRYYEDREGNPCYDFSRFDSMTDRYVSQGLPLVVDIFPFPAPLPGRFHPETAPTKEKWISLVSTLVKHMHDRLERAVMHAAIIRLWTDPTVYAHWQGTQTDFCNLLASLCHAIQCIDERLKVGLQQINPENITTEWLRSLQSALDQQKTRLYFIGCRVSLLRLDPAMSPGRRFPPETGRGYVLTDPQYPLQLIRDFRKKMTQGGLFHPKLWITSVMPTGLWNDQTQNTSFRNAFMAKMLLALLPLADHIHFDTDFTAMPRPLLALPGRDGFHTAQALADFHTNIFRLLARLGRHILRQGTNYIVTADGDRNRFQILCYNYCHYRADLKTPDDLTKLPVFSLYSAFAHGETQRIVVTLQDCHGLFRVKRYRLNPQHGSAFDAWLQTGAPETPSREDQQYIQSHARPDCAMTIIHSEGSYTFDCLVAPHEVECIEIIPEQQA